MIIHSKPHGIQSAKAAFEAIPNQTSATGHTDRLNIESGIYPVKSNVSEQNDDTSAIRAGEQFDPLCAVN